MSKDSKNASPEEGVWRGSARTFPWCLQSRSRAVPCPAPLPLCSLPFSAGNACGCLQPGALLLWELSTARRTGKSPNLLPAKLCAYLQTKKAVLGSYLFFPPLLFQDFGDLRVYSIKAFFFLHLPSPLASSVSQLLLKGGDLS